MRLDWLQTSTEEHELAALLVDLDPLSIVLNLGIHSVGTLLHCHRSGATCLSLTPAKNTREKCRYDKEVSIFTVILYNYAECLTLMPQNEDTHGDKFH